MKQNWPPVFVSLIFQDAQGCRSEGCEASAANLNVGNGLSVYHKDVWVIEGWVQETRPSSCACSVGSRACIYKLLGWVVFLIFSKCLANKMQSVFLGNKKVNSNVSQMSY